ncbi:glycoside hydrolase family 3 C-terminal domain-containing protein [Modestobacter marinus]|uniref:Beta-glucosidase n=1 Tax=Modestobacter marinus TaxID=477641 RepID=A0A846LU23_9ACTN|nr:glycoside hydrolase family 3 C-terminal domain-containing protein [Modestobacter marinus]NIH69145.1 beta-glucosidase [Modestobacter marinus]GGL77256.1 beta-glucosidase [Modestobacter marinus]
MHRPDQTRPDLPALIARLDLKAKVRLLTGGTMYGLHAEEDIGLAEIHLSDGPTGVRGLTFTSGPPVTLFPNASLLASTWSDEVLHETGRLLAEEAQAQDVHVVLGPTINLHRSLLGGRLFEAFSEDPYLSGRLATAYVHGLQEQGVGACLKHVVANESETDRHSVDSVVDEATLREVYLLPFEMAVADAQPWSVMAAYNRVNGVPATEHDGLLNGVVKGEWAYDGVVVSDWFATRSTAQSANGGLDLVMPGPVGPWGDALVAAVSAGEVDEAVVDDHLHRLLLLAERVGALGAPRPAPAGLPRPDGRVRREQLTKLAAQGMTLVRNERATLPLERGTTVALVGRHAIDTICMGGGSAQVRAVHQVSVEEGLTALLGSAVRVVDGVEVRSRAVAARAGTVLDPVTGEGGVHVVLLGADGEVIEERHERTASSMIGVDDDLPAPVTEARFRAVVPRGGELQLGALGVGSWRFAVAGAEVGRIELRLSSDDAGEAILRPPSGTVLAEVPDGALVEATVDLRSASGLGRPGRMAGAGLFGLVAGPAPRDPELVLGEAAAAARDADVAVVVVGLTEEEETESVDKATLALPGDQDALVRTVAAAARRTVVVVNAATPVLMPWLEEVDAVLVAGLPGQEAGHAVAAVLLGDREPAGRLVTTWPVADGAAPAWSVTPVDGRLPYAEGAFLGHRGHAAGRAPAPAFWFGHGLGYGRWQYTDARLVTGPERPGAAVTVTNTGLRPSREVVQVYLRPADPEQPVRLAGWQAVTLAPGESRAVEVPTDPRMWRRWDVATAAWAQLPVTGELLLARGLGDVRAALPLSDD